jgi:hypothetical protein
MYSILMPDRILKPRLTLDKEVQTPKLSIEQQKILERNKILISVLNKCDVSNINIEEQINGKHNYGKLLEKEYISSGKEVQFLVKLLIRMIKSEKLQKIFLFKINNNTVFNNKDKNGKTKKTKFSREQIIAALLILEPLVLDSKAPVMEKQIYSNSLPRVKTNVNSRVSEPNFNDRLKTASIMALSEHKDDVAEALALGITETAIDLLTNFLSSLAENIFK